MRQSENAHLPFDRLTALSKAKAEGLRYPHPSSLQRTSMYASRRYRSLAVIPRDFGSLASGHFPSASEEAYFSTVSKGVTCAAESDCHRES
jgi:hypothetical protein